MRQSLRQFRNTIEKLNDVMDVPVTFVALAGSKLSDECMVDVESGKILQVVDEDGREVEEKYWV